MRRSASALGLLLVVAAGCANIPEQSTPQAEPNFGAQSPGAVALPNPKADPLTLVRDFVGQGDNPDAAKQYLTEEAKKSWKGDAAPTIIDETFGTAPDTSAPADRKTEGDESNVVTVVLSVTPLGRLGADRAFIPVVRLDPYRVTVVRASENDPWRIQKPPSDLLITKSEFNASYQRVSLYFFDPEFRVIVPDLRYVIARPPTAVADRVVRLLLDGPSDTLDGAVKTMLSGTEVRTNAVTNSDGALEINLTKLGDRTPEQRQLIAAQVLLSLRDVTQGRVRLLVDGHQLIEDHGDWRVSDLPSYDALTKPNVDLPGLYTTAIEGRVRVLRVGNPVVPGPAGSGEFKVQSAAQSIDGKALAVVEEVSTGVRLRIGAYGGPLPEVDLQASTLTRPTWLLGNDSNAGSNEVWTVQNGVDVVRMVRTGNDRWASSPVNASDLRAFGTITDLRLSRDGVRLAAVIGGQLVVASVVRARDSVAIRSPRALQTVAVRNVVGVDWRNQDTVVVATGDTNRPVVGVPMDGFTVDPYNSSNLTGRVSAVAAAPERDVVVTDVNGMWGTSETIQVWHPLYAVPGAHPFYPG